MVAAAIILLIIVLLFFAAAVIFFNTAAARNVSGLASMVITAAMPAADTKPEAISDGYAFWEEADKTPVEITSIDGLTLRGEYCRCENPKRNIICVHGYRADGISNFAAVLPDFMAMDSNILLIDQRACGKSDGKYICFGMKERIDLLLWAKWLNDNGGSDLPLYFDGVSLGGTTVLMASDLNLPPNIAGIIADCGYTSPFEILKYIIKTYMPFPTYPVLWLIDLINRIVTGYWLTEVDTRQCVKNAKVPILFVHGAKDRFVPLYMGMENYDACASEKKIFVSENAEHGMSYIESTKECKELLTEFFEKNDGSAFFQPALQEDINDF